MKCGVQFLDLCLPEMHLKFYSYILRKARLKNSRIKYPKDTLPETFQTVLDGNSQQWNNIINAQVPPQLHISTENTAHSSNTRTNNSLPVTKCEKEQKLNKFWLNWAKKVCRVWAHVLATCASLPLLSEKKGRECGSTEVAQGSKLLVWKNISGRPFIALTQRV